MPEHPLATLITVTYNSADVLRRSWPTLPPQLEWIVVDNASTDGSADVARDLGATVIPLPRNAGFSAANNVGVGRATSDVVIFCNPDVTVTADGVERLAAEVRRSGGLLAPQLINDDGSLQENGRGAPYPIRKLRHMFGRSASAAARYHRLAPVDQIVDAVWMIGAAVAVTIADFQLLGGWDEQFFVYYEDSDLGLRALEAGMPVRIDGRTRWVHSWERATRTSRSWRPWAWEIRSAWRFYVIKHRYAVIPVGRRGRALRQRDHTTRLMSEAGS